VTPINARVALLLERRSATLTKPTAEGRSDSDAELVTHPPLIDAAREKKWFKVDSAGAYR
jgi:hypothetical protein